VTHPERMVAECARVLKPGGMLVLTGPFYWPLHEEPHDYHRFTCHGFENLLRNHGFKTLSIEPDCGALTLVAVAIIEILPRWALVLVPVINTITPWLQRWSTNRKSTLNYVVVGRKDAVAALPSAPVNISRASTAEAPATP
jgi:SAM-dependent methyltransferase